MDRDNFYILMKLRLRRFDLSNDLSMKIDEILSKITDKDYFIIFTAYFRLSWKTNRIFDRFSPKSWFRFFFEGTLVKPPECFWNHFQSSSDLGEQPTWRIRRLMSRNYDNPKLGFLTVFCLGILTNLGSGRALLFDVTYVKNNTLSPCCPVNSAAVHPEPLGTGLSRNNLSTKSKPVNKW